jgi:outer membrane cobalamin receptor
VNPAAGYVIVGNADLVPESSWSTDAGLTWSPAANFALDIDAYRNRVSNLIDFRMTGLTPSGYQTFQNRNVAHARTEGAELEARFASPALNASLGYNYLRARDVDNDRPLDRRATHSGRVQLSREWAALRNLRSDLSAHYTGAAPVGDTAQAAFLSVDAQLRMSLSDRVELSTGVNNLLDARPSLWTPAFQRQVFVGVRARFGARD